MPKNASYRSLTVTAQKSDVIPKQLLSRARQQAVLSTMPTTLVSPMNDVVVGDAVAAPRLASLQGKTVALLDITKPGGSFFLDRLESVLKKRFGVASVIRE